MEQLMYTCTIVNSLLENSGKKKNKKKQKKMDAVFSRVLRDTTPRFVRRSVGRSVGWLVGRSVGPHFTLFMFLRSLASLHLPKCFSNSNTAPAHPHTTWVVKSSGKK